MTLNREDLRKSAASRRTDDIVHVTNTWHCDDCQRDFVRESMFMAHFCPDRERKEELKSPRGQTAYMYYSAWMRLMKRSIPSIETFSTSKQYKHFIKFVDWSSKTAMPKPESFIKLMVDASVLPMLWCRNNTYEMYLDWHDEMMPPEMQFIETMDRLKQLAEDHGVPTTMIYSTLGADQIANLIRQRKLSPWLLVVSPRFLSWAGSLEAHDRDTVVTAVNVTAFLNKMKNQTSMVAEFRAACDAEGL